VKVFTGSKTKQMIQSIYFLISNPQTRTNGFLALTSLT
jgi:hypothetical protein